MGNILEDPIVKKEDNSTVHGVAQAIEDLNVLDSHGFNEQD